MTYVHVTRKTIDNFVEVSAREDPVRSLPLAISTIYEWHEVNSYSNHYEICDKCTSTLVEFGKYLDLLNL